MKKIQIDSEKCTGCRTCEVICSLTHNKGLVKPRLARVRVYRDETEGVFTPIIPGPKTSIEYVHKPQFLMGNRTGDIDILWSLFSDSSRRCNLCGICTQWCVTGALRIKEM
jgi:benzoyl-CoA reductase subunit BamC